MRSTVLIVLAAGFLSACGTPNSATPAISPTSTPSATSSRPTKAPVLLVVQTKVATSDHPGSIGLFATDGTPAGSLQLKPGWAVLSVAGSRIFVRAGDGSLDALKRDGTLEVLEPAAETVAGIGGLTASPDGKEWVWASQMPDSTSQSVYMAGDKLATRKVVERAKGIMQRDLSVSEEEAYAIIQKQARHRRKSMKEISEAILLAEDLKRGSRPVS